MNSSILGAETGQMDSLAAQLGVTSTDIGDIQAETQTTSQTVVAEIESSFASAVRGIDDAMQRLRASVDSARARLGETTWTGHNAIEFESGYGSFSGAMVNFEAAVSDAFLQFDTQLRSVGETITTFQGHVTTSMQQAQDSTMSMQQAVLAQKANLESVMNQGLSFGAQG